MLEIRVQNDHIGELNQEPPAGSGSVSSVLLTFTVCLVLIALRRMLYTYHSQ